MSNRAISSRRWCTKMLFLVLGFLLVLAACGGEGSGEITSSSGGGSVTPSVTLSAIPTTVDQNGSTSLEWSSVDTTACTASGSWSGSRPTSGSELLTNLTNSGTYTLTCTGTGGSTSQSVIVTVLPPKPAAGSGLANVTISNNGSTGNVVATFGHSFRKGDIAAENTVGAKLADGTVVALQADKKSTHSDGSLRHAVVTANIGSLGGGQSKTITLYSKAAGSAGTPVSLSDLLATNFDAIVSLNIGGTVYTASAKDFLVNNNPNGWLSGPEVSEWIVGGPVRNGVTPHPHLAAYFHVRAYAGSPINRVRVYAVVENGWTFKAGSTAYSYNATVTVGGSTVYSNASLTHYHHSRWHVVGWWGGASSIYVKPDTQYLRNTLAVPNYDNSITLQSSVLNGYAQTITPMGHANLRTSWADTGYDSQIGLMPEWDAAFVISGDQRAYNAVLANASAGGSYSYHYRDENTGGLPSIDTYPTLSEQGPSGGLVPGSGGNPNSHDDAHAPLLGYLAYLLTGDYFYLEELQFLANWHMLYNNAQYREGSQGILGIQNRAQAWGIRTISHAAAATPDGYTVGGIDYKSYFIDKLNNNITDREVKWANGPTNILGMVQDYDWPNAYAPWMNNFFVASMNRVVELGFTQGVALRNWFNLSPKGLLGTTSSEYCYVYAAPYHFNAGIVDGSNNYYASFRALYEANFPTASGNPCPTNSLMVGAYADEPTGYYSNMQPGVAMAVDAGAVTAAQWDLFKRAGTPDYTGAPVWAVVPRTIP